MISQTVEYCLRLVVALASQQREVLTSRELAQAANIPQPYLSKLMRDLVCAGLVRSQRGLHGGYQLARPSADITVWDVVEAVDPVRRLSPWPLREGSPVRACALYRFVNRAIDHTEQAFRAISLEDIVNDCGPSPAVSERDSSDSQGGSPLPGDIGP